MNIVRITVPNPDELLHASAYGTGGKVRLESSPDGTVWTEESSQTLAAGIEIYTFYDQDGTSTTYYRSRYSDASSTLFSSYSDPFRVTTYPIEYTSLPLLKHYLSIPQTDATDDALLEMFVNEANDLIETKIGFPVGPVASEARTFDGNQFTSPHVLSVHPYGVRTISQIRYRSTTDGDWTTLDAADYLTRPSAHAVEPGWPAFEIWLSDASSTITSWPYGGYGLIEVTATWGWERVPPALTGIATRLAAARWYKRGRASGSPEGDFEDPMTAVLTALDWQTIDRYRTLGPSTLMTVVN